MDTATKRVTLADLVEQYQGQDPAYVLLDPPPTAEALDLGSVKTLEAWRREGKGPAFLRIGRKIKYPLSGIMAFATEQLQTTTRQGKAGGVR